jgi:hypothetical protein
VRCMRIGEDFLSRDPFDFVIQTYVLKWTICCECSYRSVSTDLTPPLTRELCCSIDIGDNLWSKGGTCGSCKTRLSLFHEPMALFLLKYWTAF